MPLDLGENNNNNESALAKCPFTHLGLVSVPDWSLLPAGASLGLTHQSSVGRQYG